MGLLTAIITFNIFSLFYILPERARRGSKFSDADLSRLWEDVSHLSIFFSAIEPPFIDYSKRELDDPQKADKDGVFSTAIVCLEVRIDEHKYTS